MAKSSGLKRRPASEVWLPQVASVEALTTDNIEQAADLGAGYVIIKLRTPAKARPTAQVGKTIGTALPGMTRQRLAQAMDRAVTLTATGQARQRPAGNAAFMQTMAEQERESRTELEHDGRLIAADELATRLGVSAQAISQALKAGRLFALEGSGRRLLYPAFYAEGSIGRRVLETVTRALGDIPASSKWQFFTNPKGSLDGRTPLEALARGDRQAVLATAAGFAER